MFYAAFFDLMLHYVGPFETTAACDAHAAACRAAGDQAEYRGPVPVAEAESGIDVSTASNDLDLIRSMQEQPMKAYIDVKSHGTQFYADVVDEQDYFERGPFARSHRTVPVDTRELAIAEAKKWAEDNRYTVVSGPGKF